jgi:two-component system, chemotaxis family, protein-glutamate methylesterase/glutaminase
MRQSTPQTINLPDQHPWNAYPSAISLVALAGSAGSLQGFRAILGSLPHGFPVPVLICQHRGRPHSQQDMLVEILGRCCSFRVIQARADSPLQGGVAYISPPDRHLLVSSGRIGISDAPARSYYRPSVDALFESLAIAFGRRLIVVVLSGRLTDGALGVVKVKANGGRVIVQDPLTAMHDGMPNAVISSGCADFVLPVDSIASALTTLTMVPGSTDLFPVSMPLWSK